MCGFLVNKTGFIGPLIFSVHIFPSSPPVLVKEMVISGSIKLSQTKSHLHVREEVPIHVILAQVPSLITLCLACVASAGHVASS